MKKGFMIYCIVGTIVCSAYSTDSMEKQSVSKKGFLTKKRFAIGVTSLVATVAAYKLGLFKDSYNFLKTYFSFSEKTNVQQDMKEAKDLLFDYAKGTRLFCEQKFKSLVKLFGTDVMDQNGCTPLYYAVDTDNIPLAKMLLDANKADINKHPDLILYAKSREMKDFLIQHNASFEKAFETAVGTSLGDTFYYLTHGADPSKVVDKTCYKVYPLVQSARVFRWTKNKLGY